MTRPLIQGPEDVPSPVRDSRRAFLGTAASMGLAGGLLVGCRFFRKKSAVSGQGQEVREHALSAWVHVATNDVVTVVVDKAEMGQGVLTLYAGIVAEELGLDPLAVKTAFAPAEEVYANRAMEVPILGIDIPVHVQITGLSSSTADAWGKLRTVAAEARARLVGAAAAQWGVAPAAVDIVSGLVVEKGGAGRRAGVGAFAEAAGRLAVPAQVRTKPVEDYARLGRDPLAQGEAPGASAVGRRVDVVDKVSGRAVFGLDVTAAAVGVERLDMAVVVRNPQVGGKVGIDVAAAQAVLKATFGAHADGIRVLPILDGRGVGIVAPRLTRARKAADTLVARGLFRYSDGPNAALDSDALVERYLRMARGTEQAHRFPLHFAPLAGARLKVSGGATTVREFAVPYVPHATMEPMNATVAFVGGRWTLWTGTQFPEAARAAVARAVGVGEELVNVVSTHCGGGFGRRLLNDYVMEAAALCKALGGGAVKLVWSREDDFQYDYFRPVAVHRIESNVQKGRVVAWRHDVVTQSLNAFVTEDYVAAILPDALKAKLQGKAGAKILGAFAKIGSAAVNKVGIDPFSVEGAHESQYDIPAFDLESVQPFPKDIPKLPVGYWRSVGHSHSAFAMESFVEELALSGGIDGVALRLSLLAKNPRARAVLETLVQRSGYGSSSARRAPSASPVGRVSGLGLALHSGWGSFCAMAAFVEVDTTTWEVRVKKMWAVVDVGFCLQPDIVRAQVEGGIVFGLTAALKQEMTVRKGVVQERNFHASDLLRMHECPVIDVHILSNPQHTPTGVGELPVPPVAPAVANALFHATGVRARRLPLSPARLAALAKVLLVGLCTASLFSAGPAKAAGAGPGSAPPTGGRAFSDGKAAFKHLHAVATHPRCVNCHGALKEGGIHVPLVGDAMKPHPMNVDNRIVGLGYACTSCHQKENLPLAGTPPGASNDRMKGFLWQPPPPSMILFARMSPRELCELWTDPVRNARTPGGRGSLSDLKTFRKEFMHHVEDDPLIHWAFRPGGSRTPAPGDVATLVSAMDAWIRWLEAGNDCTAL